MLLARIGVPWPPLRPDRRPRDLLSKATFAVTTELMLECNIHHSGRTRGPMTARARRDSILPREGIEATGWMSERTRRGLVVEPRAIAPSRRTRGLSCRQPTAPSSRPHIHDEPPSDQPGRVCLADAEEPGDLRGMQGETPATPSNRTFPTSKTGRRGHALAARRLEPSPFGSRTSAESFPDWPEACCRSCGPLRSAKLPRGFPAESGRERTAGRACGRSRGYYDAEGHGHHAQL